MQEATIQIRIRIDASKMKLEPKEKKDFGIDDKDELDSYRKKVEEGFIDAIKRRLEHDITDDDEYISKLIAEDYGEYEETLDELLPERLHGEDVMTKIGKMQITIKELDSEYYNCFWCKRKQPEELRY